MSREKLGSSQSWGSHIVVMPASRVARREKNGAATSPPRSRRRAAPPASPRGPPRRREASTATTPPRGPSPPPPPRSRGPRRGPRSRGTCSAPSTPMKLRSKRSSAPGASLRQAAGTQKPSPRARRAAAAATRIWSFIGPDQLAKPFVLAGSSGNAGRVRPEPSQGLRRRLPSVLAVV